ncbi:MAG: FAD-dependent thymidylate synthase [Syntrophorhabdaceae bacterium]|nr:FAD-dependent thymidylate synthase [Syntrophorhabdaceae bacterium]
MESELKVVLLAHTPHPEETVAAAAKLCYSASDVDAIKETVQAKDQHSFIERLVDMGHLSPIEHACFTFAVEGISRACSHQLVRHRLASYSQQSQRYVGMGDGFGYIIPPSIDTDPVLKERFGFFMEGIQEFYNELIMAMKARGIEGESAYEDARFVLPNAAETKIIMTMNARELLHFFAQRCCRRAQWEIRAMATEMLRLARRAAPAIFRDAGPACLSGSCPEGAYSCGGAEEVRELFRTI